jgi:hypothetical protein
VAAVVSFIDCINRGDVEGLGSLMTEDHQLRAFDEPPLDGKEANIAAWRGYCDSFPEYVICPQGTDAQRNPNLSTCAGSHSRSGHRAETYGTLLRGKVLVAASTLRVLVIGINRRKEHNEQNIPCSAAVDGVDADYRLR